MAGKAGAARPTQYPELDDRDWLTKHYVEAGMSGREVAALIGCHRGSVEYALKKFNIPRRGRHYGRWHPKCCARCGGSFVPGGPAAMYCSAECRTSQRACVACQSVFVPTKLATGQQAASKQEHCSDECRNWTIQQKSLAAWDRRRKSRPPRRRISVGGYVELYYGAPGGGYLVREHRQVMEDAIGRPLLPSETVHHINGDKTDNRLKNLQLRNGHHGSGVVHRCNSCGSHDISAVEISDPDN